MTFRGSETPTTPLGCARGVGRVSRAAQSATVGAIAGVVGVLGLVAVGGVVVAAPAGASSHVTTVKAVETDFHIALSKKTFTPGKYTFLAQNKGQTTHALQITGPGLKNAKTKNFSPGQSAKLTVTFKSGRYDIFCPVPGHKALGMNVNIVVRGSVVVTSSSTSTSGG
jgi:plastocyanin